MGGGEGGGGGRVFKNIARGENVPPPPKLSPRR